MKRSRAKTVAEPDPDEIRPEYDFTNARPNPYATRFAAGAITVVLDPDVAERFPDAKSVNEALRSLLDSPRRRGGKRPPRRRTG
ncbi:MAG: hypothetical protein WD825_08215 [Gemmatimonadaceae bacterium]